MDNYDANKEIARQMWNSQSQITACYVQWCGGTEWRVSDNRGSIVGYIDIAQEAISER